MDYINKIAKLITEDPDVFNEGWDELGIEDPFPQKEPDLRDKINIRRPDTTEEDLQILETARFFANLEGLDWDELPRDQRVALFKQAQQWHIEHGFD